MITVTDLQRVNIFKDLPAEKLSALIPHLAEKTFPPGATIIYHGDPGYSMFMVIEGSVAVTRANDEGVEYTLNTLEPGEIFGEISLMTGEPRSANIKSLSAVRLFELEQKAFFELVTTYPAANENLLRLLVQRRTKDTVNSRAEGAKTQNIASLFAQAPPDIDRFLGKTKWTTDTNAVIEQLAVSSENLLILGEHGTGKGLAARLIHFRGPGKEQPLLHLDCANPPPVQRVSEEGTVAEKNVLHREIAQEAALFGHSADAGSYTRSVRRGYIEIADGGTLILENVEALSLRVQRRLAQFLQKGGFSRSGETQVITSRVRLLATTSRPLEGLKEETKFDPELLALVGGESLVLKPLRERKKDISVIAEYFLSEYSQKFAKNVSGFSKEALNLLVDHDWPLNVDELRQVVERAVVIATGDIVMEGQVFLNLPTFTTTGKYNLLRIPSVREMANHGLFPTGLRFVTIPFILALIVFTHAGPPENNSANLIVWAVWWPFLILSIIVSARGWCGYCPLPTISEGLNFYRKKFLPVPGFLTRNGLWIGVGGFALILLSEHAARMFTAAHATSVLLLTILGGAVITHFLFGKRSWCKHICPLGKMVAQTSTLSFIELGSNSTVCSSQCQTHDCVKDANCPMGIHPSAATASKDCILCLCCVKRCKHQAIRINVRLPWNELVGREKWDVAGALFAVFLTALVLAVKLPSWEPFARFMARRFSDNLLAVDIAVAVTVCLVFTGLALLLSGFLNSNKWKQYFAVSGYAYLFLAFAGFFNIYFHEFVYHAHNLLPWTLEQFGLSDVVPAAWITPNLGTLKALVPVVTLAGAISSIILLKKLSEKFLIPSFVRRGHQGVLFMTTLIYLIILQ